MRILFIFLLLITFSCTKDKSSVPTAQSKLQKIKIYNEDDFDNKIKIIDTICENDLMRAENDIKKGNLSINVLYIFRRWNNNFKTREKNYYGLNIEKKIIPHLEKFDIKLDTNIILISSIRQQYDHFFNEYCYEERMREEIQKRFGTGFIDSLAEVIEKEHVKNNKDQVFDIQDADLDNGLQGITYSEFVTKCRIDFGRNFKYPKYYNEKNEKSFSYTTAEFTLMKDGKIKNLIVEANFENPENEKYRYYFENEIRKFVLSTKWVHPLYSGQIVNSNMNFTYWHK